MADKVSFGDWEMPVNFIPTNNGGQCTPGCHAQVTYDRNRRPGFVVPTKSADPESEVTEKNPSQLKEQERKGPGTK